MIDLRSQVFEALENAKDNGIDYSQGNVNVDTVAGDMICNCSDLEAIEQHQLLVPHIQEWIKTAASSAPD